ncbi:Glycosyl transferase, group 2 family protein [Brucella melitensis]|nr:Glycosyl transferase, group 2 family protein [Brucella melitensis]
MTPQLFSAARVLDTPQAFVIAMAVYAFLGCIVNWPMKTMLALHVAMSLFFFGCVLIRLFAAASGKRLQFTKLRLSSRVICRSILYWCRSIAKRTWLRSL